MIWRLIRLWRRVRAWHEQRHAIEQLIAESRSYARGATACERYRPSRKLEVRNGVLSNFCRSCGQPCGAHRKVAR